MKKSIIFALITMTLVFSSYVGGFYVGRNYSLGDTQILGLLPESTQPVTTASAIASDGTNAPVTTVIPSTAVSTLPTIPSSTATLPTEPTEPTVPPVTAPTMPPTVAPTVPPTTESTATKLININTATLEQLDTLPGIGPKLAQAIIDYRTEYGPFETPEDLLYVPGIGEKKLAAIIDLITTGG